MRKPKRSMSRYCTQIVVSLLKYFTALKDVPEKKLRRFTDKLNRLHAMIKHKLIKNMVESSMHWCGKMFANLAIRACQVRACQSLVFTLIIFPSKHDEELPSEARKLLKHLNSRIRIRSKSNAMLQKRLWNANIHNIWGIDCPFCVINQSLRYISLRERGQNYGFGACLGRHNKTYGL